MISNAFIGAYMPVLYLPGGAMHFMHRRFILFEGHTYALARRGPTVSNSRINWNMPDLHNYHTTITNRELQNFEQIDDYNTSASPFF